jgi:quercetin dioxygenase-like cupin family protein
MTDAVCPASSARDHPDLDPYESLTDACTVVTCPVDNPNCSSATGSDAKGDITDVRDKKARSSEDSLEILRPVQALDTASVAERLREEKTYEDHGRSVLSLYRDPSLRAVLTAIATGRRTGERRVACLSTVHVLEGEVRFKAGEERHVLSVGGTLLLKGNVPYEAEALSDAIFLHTVVQPAEEGGAE